MPEVTTETRYMREKRPWRSAVFSKSGTWLSSCSGGHHSDP